MSCPNNDVKTWLLNKEKWGYDYTFDCTGNVEVMRSFHFGFEILNRNIFCAAVAYFLRN
jgi:Zn-dependent alcohol dehydrogenase